MTSVDVRLNQTLADNPQQLPTDSESVDVENSRHFANIYNCARAPFISFFPKNVKRFEKDELFPIFFFARFLPIVSFTVNDFMQCIAAAILVGYPIYRVCAPKIFTF